MRERIRNLDDATAVRVVQAFSTAQSRHGNYETIWTPELRQSLEQALEESAVTTNSVREGDLAREALLLLADDPANAESLSALIQHAPPQKYLDTDTIAIGVAALVVLQTYVKFERTKDGKIHFKIEKQPLPVELMRTLIAFFAGSNKRP